MRILLTGASGLIGTTLSTRLTAQGHELVALTRGEPPSSPSAREGVPPGSGRAAGAQEAGGCAGPKTAGRPPGPRWRRWDPLTGEIETPTLERLDAVIHLAAENLAAARWNERVKVRLLESRVVPTRRLAERVAAAPDRPAVWINASAVGVYGDRGTERLTEDSATGIDWLANLCLQWEAATAPAEDAGIRVVRLRLGVVLAREGGALPRLARPFRFGAGARLGNGRHYLSWIALDDVVDAVSWILARPDLRGPVNAVSPHPVTNAEFTRALGRALRRPALFAVPRLALRLLVGELADASLLASQRALPARLQGSGFAFRHPDLDGALRSVLRAGRPAGHD